MNAYDDGSRSQVNAKDRYIESSGTPPGCRLNNIAFPVVSADSDHRLLSCNPSGCAEVSQLYSSLWEGNRHQKTNFTCANKLNSGLLGLIIVLSAVQNSLRFGGQLLFAFV